MKTKLFTLLLVQFMALTIFAGNVITYTANEKLPETTSSSWPGLHTNAFNVAISSHSFSNGTGTITFSGDVTSIGDFAFSSCSSLTSVTIPNSVTSIGRYAFSYCSGLTSVTIPNSVTSIGYMAFADCSGLTSITIPNSVTSIGNYAFDGCSGLTSITIPNSVTSIGDYAFDEVNNIVYDGTATGSPWGAKCANGNIEGYFVYSDADKTQLVGCSSLATGEITIPNSVTSIGDYAFSGCSGLTSVTIGNSVTSIEYYAFYGCSGLTSVTIPNSVTSIGDAAFYCCSGLTSVTIPNSVTSIGSSAFSGCSGLTSITIPNSVTSIGERAFSGCSGLTSVTIPNSVTNIGRYIFQGCSGLTSITIPESVTSIGYYAFSGCSGLTSVTIPNSVTSIGYAAFGDCSGLTSITIPNSVTSIGEWAFQACSGLTSITIPNSVTTIGNYAFSGCSSLPVENDIRYADTYLVEVVDRSKSTYSIKEGTKWIGNHAFIYCLCLTSVTIPNSVTSIGKDAFYGCSNLTSVTIPNSVTSLGDQTFFGCSGLTSITIGNSVTGIGDQTFSGCSGLTSITIPNSVTSISSNAFSGCTGITSVVWNARSCQSPSSYNDAPFYGIRTNIASFNFGDEVSKIPAYLCYGMSNLSDVIIPNSVSSIGDKAFYGCKRLVKVTCFANTPPAAQATSFQYYDCDLFVPCDELRTYKRDEVFGQFENIQCISAEQGSALTNVVVTPSENSANIVWPKDDAADTYTIDITKDGTTICTLTFNSNGQLMNIAFAPSRAGESPARVAESINGSWSFTVTSLDPATTYAYTVTTKNAAQSVINTYTGNFTTTGTTGIETVNTGVDTLTKFLRDGQILIQRGNTTYNLRGQVVK